jgi:hypothetical protein
MIKISSLNANCGVGQCRTDLFGIDRGTFMDRLIGLIACLYRSNPPELATIQIDFVTTLSLKLLKERSSPRQFEIGTSENDYFFGELEKFCREFVRKSYNRLVNLKMGQSGNAINQRYHFFRNTFADTLEGVLSGIPDLALRYRDSEYTRNVVRHPEIGLIVYDLYLLIDYLNSFRRYHKTNTSLVDLVNFFSLYDNEQFEEQTFGRAGKLHPLYQGDYERGSNCDANSRYLGTVLSILTKNGRILTKRDSSEPLLTEDRVDYISTAPEMTGSPGHIYFGLRIFETEAEKPKQLSDYLFLEATSDYELGSNVLTDRMEMANRNSVSSLFFRFLNYSEEKLRRDVGLVHIVDPTDKPIVSLYNVIAENPNPKWFELSLVAKSPTFNQQVTSDKINWLLRQDYARPSEWRHSWTEVCYRIYETINSFYNSLHAWSSALNSLTHLSQIAVGPVIGRLGYEERHVKYQEKSIKEVLGDIRGLAHLCSYVKAGYNKHSSEVIARCTSLINRI